MELHGIPFATTDRESAPRTEHPGETGQAIGRMCRFGSIRVRMVDHTPGDVTSIGARLLVVD